MLSNVFFKVHFIYKISKIGRYPGDDRNRRGLERERNLETKCHQSTFLPPAIQTDRIPSLPEVLDPVRGHLTSLCLPAGATCP